MVFGFGEIEVDVKVSKVNFVAGETIKGIVSVKANKVKKISKISISFFGMQETIQMTTNSQGQPMRNVRQEKTYSFDQELSGEKDLNGPSEYPFEIKIPQNLAAAGPDSALGNVLNVAHMAGIGPSPPKWFLEAGISWPWSLGARKKIQITIN